MERWSYLFKPGDRRKATGARDQKQGECLEREKETGTKDRRSQKEIKGKRRGNLNTVGKPRVSGSGQARN